MAESKHMSIVDTRGLSESVNPSNPMEDSVASSGPSETSSEILSLVMDKDLTTMLYYLEFLGASTNHSSPSTEFPKLACASHLSPACQLHVLGKAAASLNNEAISDEAAKSILQNVCKFFDLIHKTHDNTGANSWETSPYMVSRCLEFAELAGNRQSLWLETVIEYAVFRNTIWTVWSALLPGWRGFVFKVAVKLGKTDLIEFFINQDHVSLSTMNLDILTAQAAQNEDCKTFKYLVEIFPTKESYIDVGVHLPRICRENFIRSTITQAIICGNLPLTKHINETYPEVVACLHFLDHAFQTRQWRIAQYLFPLCVVEFSKGDDMAFLQSIIDHSFPLGEKEFAEFIDSFDEIFLQDPKAHQQFFDMANTKRIQHFPAPYALHMFDIALNNNRIVEILMNPQASFPDIMATNTIIKHVVKSGNQDLLMKMMARADPKSATYDKRFKYVNRNLFKKRIQRPFKEKIPTIFKKQRNK